MKRVLFILTLSLVLTLAAASAWADQVTGLTTFTGGTPAYADSVNSNFSEIQDSVNDNDSRLDAIESSHMNTQHIVLSHMDFKPYTEGYEYRYQDGYWIADGASGTYYVFAPLHLPTGAEITAVNFHCFDSDGTQDVDFIFGRRDAASPGGNYTGISSGGTTPADVAGDYNISTTVDTTGNRHIIDNSQYFYYVRVDFPAGYGSALRFTSIVIEYEIPSP